MPRLVWLVLATGACLAAVSAVALAVLPQQQGSVDLLTQANITLDGAAASDRSGFSVASAGDVNGDGRSDVIVGAPAADPSSRSDAGSSYVIYGSASPSNVDLGSLGSAGFRIDGAAAGDQSGYSVASAGDVNGDGRSDVIVGAPYADPSSRSAAGSSYVIYGFGTASLSYPGAIAATVGAPIASYTPTVSRTGTATFGVSPALPAGLSLATATGVISGTPTEAASGTYTVTMTDLSGTASTAVSVTVTVTPTSSVTPVSAPTKPSVVWSKRARVVTALIKPVRGVTYRLTAKRGNKTKTGSCKTVKIKVGSKRVTRRKCTVTLATGRWILSVTPKKNSVVGVVTTKRYRIT